MPTPQIRLPVPLEMSNHAPTIQPRAAGPTSPTSNKFPVDAALACFIDTHGVITATTNDLPGYRVVRVLGTIYGLTVRARNWGADIGALLKSAVGGEIGYFTRVMYTARNEAVERLVGECLGRGGNAILGMR